MDADVHSQVKSKIDDHVGSFDFCDVPPVSNTGDDEHWTRTRFDTSEVLAGGAYDFEDIVRNSEENPHNLMESSSSDHVHEWSESAGLTSVVATTRHNDMSSSSQSSRHVACFDANMRTKMTEFDEIQQLDEDDWANQAMDVCCEGIRGGAVEMRGIKGVSRKSDGFYDTLDDDARTHLVDRTSSPCAQVSGPSPVWLYCWEMAANFTNTSTLRGKQARLTLWEFLEHFDFFNDFLFICRIGVTTFTASSATLESLNIVNLGEITMVCMMCIWLTSVIAYAMRRVIIYHRIEGENLWLFCPIVVFHKIRLVGETSPEALYMFERLFWTYQLVMRLVEDIPQVIFSAIFLSTFGSDFYTYFMIAYSLMLMVLTSYRMGVMYPVFGTLSLILSREPPVDSPVLAEAANTTKNFSGFMCIVFTLWLITDVICLYFARGLWFYTFCMLSAVSGCLAGFFFTYWMYLLHEASANGESFEEFRLNFDQLSTPRNALAAQFIG